MKTLQVCRSFFFCANFYWNPYWETQVLAKEGKTKNLGTAWQSIVNLEHKQLEVALPLEYYSWRTVLTHRRSIFFVEKKHRVLGLWKEHPSPWIKCLCGGRKTALMRMQISQVSTKKFFRKYYLSKLCPSWKRHYSVSGKENHRTILGSLIYSISNGFGHSNSHTLSSVSKTKENEDEKEWACNTLNLGSV